VLSTFGGLALFLMGMERIATALRALGGGSMRRAMAGATSSPWRSLATGTVVSAATQSGTATAATTLSLVAGGLVNVPAGLAMSFGAQIGATLAIQLAAFRLSEYALPMVALGFVLMRWPRAFDVGRLVLGAGLLFLGLGLTVAGVAGLQTSEVFMTAMHVAERQPLAVALVGFALGTVLTSTNAVAALGMGLFASGALSLPATVALVVGGNAGGTMLAVVVARALDNDAVRVAVVHTGLKLVSALLVAAVAAPAAAGVALLGGDAARQVANAHTLFNIVVAIPATLAVAALARLGGALLPDRSEPSGPQFLRDEALDHPALALGLARREIVAISDLVAEMMTIAAGNLRTGQWDPPPIDVREAKVDRLTDEVVQYLADLRSRHGEDPVSERLLLTVTELEHLGDQVRRLQRRELRLPSLGVEFSQVGRAELARTAEGALERLLAAFTAVATGDANVARSVVAGRDAFERLVAEMRLAHLGRLEAQRPESLASGPHHLHVLTLLRQMDASSTRLAGWALEEAGGGAGVGGGG
jgi:phosphate:Na+ symporter